MFAPRRNAPCWIALVASLKARQKLMGPEVVPPDPYTGTGILDWQLMGDGT